MDRYFISSFQLPPGFKFHPSDEELIVHYLQNKVDSCPLPAYVIADIDLYKCNPWDLPKMALFGDDEWYFFSPRDRKYPQGVRPNRTVPSGYWKATGTDKPIFTSGGLNHIGVKKALVFYTGRPPEGVKTEWIMTEYRLLDKIKSAKLKGSMRLDDWVLCRVRKKEYVLKSICEAQEISESLKSPKTEEEAFPISKYNPSTTTSELYKNCPVLASILAGQSPPPTETISTVSFKKSDKENSFGLGNETQVGLGKVKASIIVSCSESRVKPMKRKPTEEDWFYLLSPDKKLNSENVDEYYPPTHMVVNSEINFYSQNQSEDSIINFRSLNELASKTDYSYP